MTSIPIEVSARHVHLTDADWTALFGNTEITSEREISQPGQFVAVQRVMLRGPKGEFKKVAIVGPLRPYTQVELAMTDARALGIKAPLSNSGSIEQAAMITIVGPEGVVERAAAIVPMRHIHIGPQEAALSHLKDHQVVSVQINGPRAAKLENILIRINPDFVGRLHLDTDEGNACGASADMTAEIIS